MWRPLKSNILILPRLRQHGGSRAFSRDGKYLASGVYAHGGVSKIYVQTADGRQARKWLTQILGGFFWSHLGAG